MGNVAPAESRTNSTDHTSPTRLGLGIEDFLLVAMKHSRALMFADSNHSVVPERVDRLLSNPRLLAQFSENGYHAYFRETGARAQPFMDELSRGHLSSEEFASKMIDTNGGYLDVPTTHIRDADAKTSYLKKSLAPLISQLGHFGIHPISADVEMEQYADEFDFLMNKATPQQIETFERRDLTSQGLDDSLKLLRSVVYPDGVIPEYIRLSKDPEVAEHIKKSMTDVGSEKVFGLYGAGHSFHKDSIPNHIQGMTVILTMDSMDSYNLIKTKFQERSRESPQDSKTFPGFVFDTETGSVYSTPNADPELLKKLRDFAHDKGLKEDVGSKPDTPIQRNSPLQSANL